MSDTLLLGYAQPGEAGHRPGYTNPMHPITGPFKAAGVDLMSTGTARGAFQKPNPVRLSDFRIADTFASDFLYRIHVKPRAIKVSNPTEGAPVFFSVWSAYPWENPLDGITATGDTGLDLTLGVGEVFTGWQERVEGVIEFIAERATVIHQHAQVPVLERFEWKTDAMRSINGKVQRVSVRRNPRRTLNYDILLTNEQDLREIAITLAGKVAAPVVLPIWAEPIKLEGVAGVSKTILADASFSELKVGDTIWFERCDRGASELGRVAEIDRVGKTITVSDTIANSYAIGDYVYPCVSAFLPDGTGIQRHQTNAGRVKIEGTVTTRDSLVGHGATVQFYEGLPLLDRRPSIEGTAAESYEHHFETFDYGGVRTIVSPDPISTAKRPRIYEIDGQDELQFWRAFLAQIRGRVREFYTPTFRPNFLPAEQPGAGATEIIIAADPDYFSFWMDLVNRRDVYIERTDGSGFIQRIATVNDNLDGTISVAFGVPIWNPGEAPIYALSMLERARLATDTAEIVHLSNGAQISLTLESGIHDDAVTWGADL